VKDKKYFENKAVRPAEDKEQGGSTIPQRNQVRVRVKPGRAVNGIGGAGTEASIDEQEAKRLVGIGYVEIIKES
jgi:hypothetical protein